MSGGKNVKCYYCNQPLYQTITLKSLFKLRYHLHEKCEAFMNHEATDVIPLEGCQLVVHALFDQKKDSDELALFKEYGDVLINGFFSFNADLLWFVESTIDSTVLYYIAQLTDGFLYVITLFRSNLL